MCKERSATSPALTLEAPSPSPCTVLEEQA